MALYNPGGSGERALRITTTQGDFDFTDDGDLIIPSGIILETQNSDGTGTGYCREIYITNIGAIRSRNRGLCSNL